MLAFTVPAPAKAETLCVNFEFNPPLSRAELDRLKLNIRQHLLHSQDWLGKYFKERARIVECTTAPDSVKIAEIVLRQGAVARRYVGDFTPSIYPDDATWARETTPYWPVDFDFRDRCDYDNFLSVASAIIDYRLANSRTLVPWELSNLMQAREALKSVRTCGAFPIQEVFTSLSRRLKQIATMRSGNRPG
jgi:hypothetical protein